MKTVMSLIVVGVVALAATLPRPAQAENLAKKRAHIIREQFHRQEMGQKKYNRWDRNHQGARNTAKAQRALRKWQLHHLAVDHKLEAKRARTEHKMYEKRLRHGR